MARNFVLSLCKVSRPRVNDRTRFKEHLLSTKTEKKIKEDLSLENKQTDFLSTAAGLKTVVQAALQMIAKYIALF